MEPLLFTDTLEGGRVRKAFQVQHATLGVLAFEMHLEAGRDHVKLFHALQRSDVVDMVRALQAWLDSPQSIMPGDETA